jgi:hypothetical protein
MLERFYTYYDGDGFPHQWWEPIRERITGRVHTCDNGNEQLEVESEETQSYGFLWLRKRTVTKREWVNRKHLRFCEERTVDDPLAFLRSTPGKEVK